MSLTNHTAFPFYNDFLSLDGIRKAFRWYERQEKGLGRRFNKELRQ